MSPSAKRSYDVIVVGAGPAGSTLGYGLAKKGVDVLILEKERLPRYKACAGGVTYKAATLLNCDISPVTRQVVYGVRVVYRGGHRFTKWYGEPLIYMVMRDEFDHFLVRRAQEAGAVVIDNARVCQVASTSAGVEVRTADETFMAAIVAGADGANGVVAGCFGLGENMDGGVGVEAEIQVADDKLPRWNSLVEIDLARVRGGYGWVFPKRDHLSAGIGGPLRQAKKLKSGYGQMLAGFGLAPVEEHRLTGHPLPVIRRGQPIHRDRCLLLGDAAGLLDPVTGEGISHAVKSAAIAVPVVAECLRSGVVDLSEYGHAVSKEIMTELRAARAIVRLFTWLPGLCLDAIRGSDRLWRASCRLLRGEESYTSLKKRLGLFEFAFDLLSR